MSEGKKLRILANILGTYYVSNDEYLFFCPSCNHHKRKLSVNVNKNVFVVLRISGPVKKGLLL